jgi:hypothetical protein
MARLKTDNSTHSLVATTPAARALPGLRISAASLYRVGGIVFVLCAVIAGGILLTPQGALIVIGPLSLFAMPILAGLADFVVPEINKRTPHGWAVGGAMAAVIIAGAVILTVLAQIVVGHLDVVGIFSSDPAEAAGHLSAFPFTIPLGGLFFVLYLEVAIVSGVPQTTKHRLRDGALAFCGCIILALILYQTLANWSSIPAEVRAHLGLRNPGGPIDALDLAGIVISIAIWQVLYLFSGGGPIATIQKGWRRVLAANIAVIALGILTYWILRSVVQASVPQIAAFAAMVVAGVLAVGVLFGLPAAGPPDAITLSARALRFGTVAAVGAITFLALQWVGSALQPTWTTGSLDLWITICGLNLIGGGIMFYCRILRPRPPAGNE